MLMSVRARSTLAVVGLLVSALTLCALLAAPALASEGEGCPNEQLRQESNVNPNTDEPYSTELPECRAYEMVSPVLKAGNNAASTTTSTSVAPAGNAVSYTSGIGEFYEPEGFDTENVYIAEREKSGWETYASDVAASIIPTTANKDHALYTPDLSHEVLCGSPGENVDLEISVLTEFTCGLRGPNGIWSSATPLYKQVGTTVRLAIAIGITGASHDLSHVVFNDISGVKLLAADTATTGEGGAGGLYEIDGIGTPNATLELVNVNSNGETIGTSSPHLGNTEVAGSPGRSLHAISEDGSTVFFEATPSGGAQTVYARVDGISTVPISKPSAASCIECQTSFPTQIPAEFQGASADGSKVFFTTEQELFAGKTGNNLYEYDFDAPVGQRVTLVSRGAANAAVQGVVTSADDGSHIYFVAQGVLSATTNAEGQSATAGADNLYAFERDQSYPAGQISFIAPLCSGKELSGTVFDGQCPTASSDQSLWKVEKGTGGRDQTTSSGGYLVFDTYAHLLGEDSNASQAVYRYDALTGELAWVSHGASGFTTANEAKPAQLPPDPASSASFGAFPDVSDRGRAVSSDGSDVVFVSEEMLSPQSIEKKRGLYLWHNGVISLISDNFGSTTGVEQSPSITESGDNIFFTTTDRLVTQDPDGLVDLYDARIGGGFPAPKVIECASEVAGSERGEACQGTPSVAPLFSAPGSSTFIGGVNLTPPTNQSSGGPKPQSKKKVLTRAQKLTNALRRCRKEKVKKKRVACEVRARKKYGGKAKVTKVALKGKRGR